MLNFFLCPAWVPAARHCLISAAVGAALALPESACTMLRDGSKWKPNSMTVDWDSCNPVFSKKHRHTAVPSTIR